MSAVDQEHALIERASSGDRMAARTLVTRLMPVVRARVRLRLRQEMRANDSGDDLVQEIWTRLLANGCQMLLKYDASRGASLEGYVGMITTREVGNSLREQRAQRRGGHVRVVEFKPDAMASVEDDPAKHASASELQDRVRNYVEGELPPKGQLVFRYVFSDQLAPSDAARAMGVSIQVVYNWQHKIRSAVRALLEEEPPARRSVVGAGLESEESSVGSLKG
ncbi:MAG: sigma-70 family RNA polymerase sigma factor [Myxococcota bacterium]